MIQLVCNRCGNNITKGLAHVVLPLPAADDQHFHLACWEAIQEGTEGDADARSQ